MKNPVLVLLILMFYGFSIYAEDYQPYGVKFIGNSAFLITSKDKKVMINAPFNAGASWGLIMPLSETLNRICKAEPPFDHLDLILITHAHEDHYNSEMLETTMLNNPNARLVVPPELFTKIKSTWGNFSDLESRIVHPDIPWKSKDEMVVNGIDLKIYCEEHHLPDADRMKNYAYLMDLGGYKILHNGASSSLEYVGEYNNFELQNEDIDLAILHYFMFTTNIWSGSSTLSLVDKKIEFVKQYIHPKNIILGHVYYMKTVYNDLIEMINNRDDLPPTHVFKNSLESKTYAKGDIDYFGQETPGNKSALFAPENVSLVGRNERSLTVSPAGDELFFSTFDDNWNWSKPVFYQKENDKWIEKELPSSLAEYASLTEPSFSPDGQRLYFSCNEPGDAVKYNNRLWYVKKDSAGWSNPVLLPSAINFSKGLWHPGVADNGNIYFAYNGLIFCSKFVNGEYQKAEALPKTINSGGQTWDPYIDSNEQYIIFKSNRAGGYGQMDMYISFKNQKGEWTNLKNFGPTINSDENNDAGDVTPDGKYLTYSIIKPNNETDMYWIEFEHLFDSLRSSDYVPYLKNKIEDQVAAVNKRFLLKLTSDYFVDDGDEELTYSATLTNGDPLPEWLELEQDNKRLVGKPTELGSYEIKLSAYDSINASVTTKFKITVEGITGYNQQSEELLKVFPNPAKTFVSMKGLPSENVHYRLNSLTGQTIDEGVILDAKIDLTTVEAGVYLLQIGSGYGNLTQKLMVE